MTNRLSALTNAPVLAHNEACGSLVFLIGLLVFCSLVTVLGGYVTKSRHGTAA